MLVLYLYSCYFVESLCRVLAASSGSGLARRWSMESDDVLGVRSVILEADEQCYFFQGRTTTTSPKQVEKEKMIASEFGGFPEIFFF